MSTGKRIRQHRMARKLTQVELAKLLGITRLTVHRVETGESGVSTKKLPKWARALRTTVAELVG